MKLTTDFQERGLARSHGAVDRAFDAGGELLQGWDMMTKRASMQSSRVVAPEMSCTLRAFAAH